jgi:outer membrane protein assembly factor BamB
MRLRASLALSATVTAALLGCAACGSGAGSSASTIAAASAVASTTTASSTSKASTSKSAPPASGFGSDWTTYHATSEASGVQATRSMLRPTRRAWTSSHLDGQLYGEPLVAEGRVVAATENNTVYVMTARSGHILWSRHLGKPVPASDLPCGDISPTVGITGTPVIDSARHEIFVDVDTVIKGPSASGGVEASHRLVGLDLYTGKVELNQRAMPNAGEDQLAQLQRPGLALDQGHVIIAYGQNTGPAHGFVVSIPETGGSLHYFQIGSGRDRGAVWMGGSSPVVDPKGDIYVASADGYDLSPDQKYDRSDAVIELSPTAHLVSIFHTANWQQLSGDDLDLGTGDPALVDGFVLQVGKTDTAYLLRQGHLGNTNGQIASEPVCSGDPDGGHAVMGSVVYLPCPNGVTAIKVSKKAPHLKVLWTADASTAGSPIIAGGLVWTVGTGGAVHGLNAANGKQVASFRSAATANHFPTPSAADGLLLVPGTDQVTAFMGPAGRPPAPPAPPGT